MQNKVYRLLLGAFIFLSLGVNLQAQKSQKVFNDLFFTCLLLDYYTSPTFTYLYPENNQLEEYYYQENGSALFAAGWRFRYNVLNNFEKFSVSVQSEPSIGLGLSASGLTVPVNAPLLLGFNLGAGSTYKDDSKLGFLLAGGVEYNYILLDISGSMEGELPSNTNWVQPVVSLGFRWWNKKYRLKEINLKYGKKSIDYPDDAEDDYLFGDAFALRITYHTFLNY